jgi:hypothetical protein
MATGENPVYFLQDLSRAADDVIRHAPSDGRALGLKAWSLYHLDKLPESATAATVALPHLARDAADPLTFDVLDVLATARTREVYDAIAAADGGGDAIAAADGGGDAIAAADGGGDAIAAADGGGWSAEALPDARAAYAVLGRHPDATEAHWVRYLQLLGALRAYPAQRAVVRDALAARPASEELHSWLRFVELRDAGARALEAAYDEERLASVDAALLPTLTWYRGLASLFAAEHDVQCRDEAAARAAYARAALAFEESAQLEPAFEGSAGHYVALALAGLARLQAAGGRGADAAESLIAALRRAPGSAAQPDGLGQSPIDTARELIDALERSGDVELADRIRATADEVGVDLAGGG